MPTTKVNGIKIYYEIKGEGIPLVMIAGFTCDSTLWQAVSEDLARSFQLVMFDNRGAGKSESPDSSYTIETMAADTLALIEALGLKNPHLLGHSMGGAIIQIAAAQHGHNIGKVVIANSAAKFSTIGSLAMRSTLHLHEDGVPIPRLVESIVPWLYTSRFLSEPQNLQTLIDMQVNNPNPQTLVGHRRQFEALQGFDGNPWLKKIAVPALVISGEEDLLATPADGKALSQGIEGATYAIIPGTGHLPFVEKPREFSSMVERFLSKQLS